VSAILTAKRIVRGNPIIRLAIRVSEALIFGGPIRRSFLTVALDVYHQSLWRRKWFWWSYGEPHFTDHSITLWRLYRGNMGQGVYSLARGFHAAEHVKHGAKVLDIGCGDGSFTKRFLAPRAAHVDAVDLEQSAISISTRKNGAPNISYRVLDAVRDDLPSLGYDVITMDGVLGHVTLGDSKIILAKIKNALSPRGVFVGSESLGHEGHDHLQFFDTLDDLERLLKSTFPSVSLKVSEYDLSSSLRRREAYWTCHI
jgi:2-polyprenyl-3-methyl-5-hydroxy-6-metoxy-1,4-benzoquinol methylase